MSPDERAIRAILERQRAALHARDAAALEADADPQLLSFDLDPPLARRGPQREPTQAWLDGWAGPVTLESRALELHLGDRVAFATSLDHMGAPSRSGRPMDIWVRSTLGFRKADGRWRLSHRHVSVPFYMDGSERAATDLTP